MNQTTIIIVLTVLSLIVTIGGIWLLNFVLKEEVEHESKNKKMTTIHHKPVIKPNGNKEVSK